MVSFVAFTTLALSTVAAGSFNVAQVAEITIDSLVVGEYYRPTSNEVTGNADSTFDAPFRRAPCPGLNALANHGHIPRDGKNITHEGLGEALIAVYNLDSNLTQTLLNQVPSTFSLDYISRHNVIEHDASLVHSDEYFGGDPMSINATLVEDLLSRSLDGKTLGVTEVGEARKDRLAMCQAFNPECVFNSTQVTLAYIEAAVFIIGFGGNVNDSVSVETARSFVSEERIPDDFVASATPISLDEARVMIAKLLAVASS
ncbi:hypothetical protein BBJ28_00001100 [Nothophytophthora sp. Chile5]|nr:hypothetical protein BBJ28_00001100 [Nothophytophthora sp. Chile5]